MGPERQRTHVHRVLKAYEADKRPKGANRWPEEADLRPERAEGGVIPNGPKNKQTENKKKLLSSSRGNFTSLHHPKHMYVN